MELIDQLTSSLKINEAQAKGGAGLLFKQAQEKLSTDDFSKISKIVPGIDSMIASAPSSGSQAKNGLDSLSKVMPGLSGGIGSLSSLAGLASGFSSLGLNSGMIGKFVPIILSFVQGKGGQGVGGILEKVLK